VLGGYFVSEPADAPGTKTSGELATARRSGSWWSRSMISLRALGERDERTPPPPKGETAAVAISIVARMFIAPAIFLPVMWFGAVTDAPPVFEEYVLPPLPCSAGRAR
jgi:hypothetical protein